MTRLIVESQKNLLANWRKTKRSQMKRKIHQRRNLRKRKKRPGLENWKRCSELHYMMAWVVHRQVLEVHKKVLEAGGMASVA